MEQTIYVQTAYISGKIGEDVISPATKEKFDNAEKMLHGLGYYTFNPTDETFQQLIKLNPLPITSEYATCLIHCMSQLAMCDIICLLPDWRESPGAKAELAFAQACGMQVKELMPYGTLADWNPESK